MFRSHQQVIGQRVRTLAQTATAKPTVRLDD